MFGFINYKKDIEPRFKRVEKYPVKILKFLPQYGQKFTQMD